jgi:CcmD family protein
MYWHHGFGILGGLIWLGIVAYVLWLALRLVRALERIADKSANKPE